MTNFRFVLQVVFLLISLSGFSQVTTIARGKNITIEGIAINLKAGAAVKTMDHDYFLENLPSWGKEMENQKVTVTGRLLIYSTYIRENDTLVQAIPIMEVIRRPKIKK